MNLTIGSTLKKARILKETRYIKNKEGMRKKGFFNV